MGYLLKSMLCHWVLAQSFHNFVSAETLQPRDLKFEETQNQTYDYIIVRGGNLDLVVANRLSEDPSNSVLVIENSNIDNGPATSILYLANILNVADVYNIFSSPIPGLGNQSYRVAVGNIVGRGTIAEFGPYFEKSNSFTAPSKQTIKDFNVTFDESAYGNGPVQVTIPTFQNPDLKNFLDFYRENGIHMPREGYADPIDAFWLPNDINNVTGTRVNQILLDNEQEDLVANAVQIVSRADNSSAKVYATKEVILAAGGVFTPQLLMLSGIGPKDVLEAASITVKKEVQAVGSNYQDHAPLAMSFNLSLTFPSEQSLFQNAFFNASAAAQYRKDRTGPWATGRGSAVGFYTFKTFSDNYQNITSRLR